jgi:hypothetical protein
MLMGCRGRGACNRYNMVTVWPTAVTATDDNEDEEEKEYEIL